MSAKKSFRGDNPAMQFISKTENEAQHDIEAQEVQEGQPIHKATQGKKGMKLPRINMAFSPENLKHIQIMGRVMGCSTTEYVNRLIRADRKVQAETVKKAMEVLKMKGD